MRVLKNQLVIMQALQRIIEDLDILVDGNIGHNLRSDLIMQLSDARLTTEGYLERKEEIDKGKTF